MTLATLTVLIGTFITSCDSPSKEAVETVAEETVADEMAAEPTFDLETAKTEIVASNKEFMTLFAAGDSVGLANLYTQDAKFMMNGAPAISGKENIQSVLSGIMNSGVSGVDLRTIEVWGTQDLITEEGELSLFVGDDEVDQGKYLILWKKEDGKWHFFRDIFNSDLAPE